MLHGVDFLKDVSEADINKLADVMTPKRFSKGDYLMRKGDEADNFYIVQEGKVKICNISVGNAKYEDVEIGPGGYAGERAIITGEKRAADLIADSDTVVTFVIDKETFATVLGDLQDLISHSADKQRLAAIKLFIDSELDDASYASICKLIRDKPFKKGAVIKQQGQKTEAALYIIREGKVESKKADGTTKVLGKDAFTGEETLTHDVKTGKNGKGDLTTLESDETLTALEDCVLGVLKLRSLRRVVNTVYLGTGNKDLIAKEVKSEIKYSDLKRHTLLGK